MAHLINIAEFLSLRRLGLSEYAIENDIKQSSICLCGNNHHAACTFVGSKQCFLSTNIRYEFVQESRKKRKNYSCRT